MIEIRSAFNPIDYFTELTPKSDDEKPVKKVSYWLSLTSKSCYFAQTGLWKRAETKNLNLTI